MGCVPALKVAIDLLHLPSQAALIRAGPLPDDVLILLRIAAGDEKVTNQASVSEGRSPEMIREAAAFFLEQVLFHADADSYRVLGVTSKASYPELRRNMNLLLQWLHPDLDRREARSVFAAKVTRAWNDLKTPERRAAYDRARDLAKAKKSSLHGLRTQTLSRSLRFGAMATARSVRTREYAVAPPTYPTAEFSERFSFCYSVGSHIGSNRRIITPRMSMTKTSVDGPKYARKNSVFSPLASS